MKEKLKYYFDEMMSKGAKTLVLALCVTTLVFVSIIAVIAWFIECGENGIISTIWSSLMFVMDPGALSESDSNNAKYLGVMLITTLYGLLMMSFLIGIINSGMEKTFDRLKQGKSKVIIKDHVVILGYDENTIIIIKELIEANASEKNKKIIILDDKLEKSEMEEELKARIPDTKTTKLICRKGKIHNLTDISICAIENSKSVIINSPNDYITIKAILAVTSILKRNPNTKCYSTAVIYDMVNLNAAKIASEGYAEILYFKDVISKIIAQTCKFSGLSSVFIELFDYDGDEIYIEEVDNVKGKAFNELNNYFAKSIVLGCVRGDEILLNPKNFILNDEKLILLAEDNDVTKLEGKADINPIVNKVTTKKESEKQNLLVLGINSNSIKTLKEYDLCMTNGAHVTVIVDEESKLDECKKVKFKNIEIDFLCTDIYDVKHIEQYITKDIHGVLVSSGDDEELADSKNIVLLLQLRMLATKNNLDFFITSEMEDVENQEIVRVTKVKDFIVTKKITNLILTQISQQRELSKIFENLLNDKGSNIYMKYACNYVETNKEYSLFDVSNVVAKNDEVFIGYRKYDSVNAEFDIIINPNKNNKVTFEEEDVLIVLSDSE